jgi:iron complex outermembrane recepter protein
VVGAGLRDAVGRPHNAAPSVSLRVERRHVRVAATIAAILLATGGLLWHQQQARSQTAPDSHNLPPINVQGHTAARPRRGRPSKRGPVAPVIRPAPIAPLPAITAATNFSGNATTPFGQPAQLDKTGTPIGDVPRSIQIVPHELFERQGATMLGNVLRDVSSAGEGGQFAFGFYDRFFIRGLDANFLSDGLPDSTSDLSGIPHTLTGVERVEILKGPGSALYGSSEPGGTINIVHYLPTGIPFASISEQIGSFGTTTTDISAGGKTTIPYLDWRVDGRYEHADGFRSQHREIAEILPTLRWRPPDHDVVVRFEYRHLDLTADATGIPFSPPNGTGLPLAVPTSYTYYTPFAKGEQDIAGIYASDSWYLNSLLTINQKTSFTNRDLDILRNAGGTVSLVGGEYSLINRQLREQTDDVNDFIYQFEPTWHFLTGSVKHVLITGADVRWVDVESQRQTANLPNIANIFAPVVPETSLSQLTFLCAAGNSCYNDHLWAHYYGVYAIDQIDLTEAWKLRVSARQNWFTTAGEANTASPVNPGNVYPCPSMPTGCPFPVGTPVSRTDAPLSWEVGTVYYLRKDLSVFTGYSNSYYPIFNSEEPQSVAQAPEHGTTYEAGVRYQWTDTVTLSSAVFQGTRQNVFNLVTEPNPSGPGNIDVAEFFNYTVTGWETDITATPTDRWIINANFTLQNPRITSYPPTPADVGNFVPSVPSVLGNAWITYIAPVGPQLGPNWGPLKLSFGVHYRNVEYADVGNTRIVPGAPIYDAALEEAISNFTWRLGINNIFDRPYYIYASGTGGGAFPGPGRTVSLRVTAKW